MTDDDDSKGERQKVRRADIRPHTTASDNIHEISLTEIMLVIVSVDVNSPIAVRLCNSDDFNFNALWIVKRILC